MSKLTKLLLIITLITTINISKVYADENNSIENKQETIDKISEVKSEQERLKKEIEYIEQAISEKKSTTQENTTEIVQLSFIENNEENYNSQLNFSVEDEITYLEEAKSSLESDVEKLVIEEVRLEKSIQSYVSMGCWPVPGFKDISSPFGYRIHPITNEKKMHKGIDIPANTDSDIVATDDGVVTFSGIQNGYGNVIEIEHFGGKTSKYAHNNKNLVSVGDKVTKGQVIAKIGSTGRSTGPHVHFEVLLNGEVKNPIEMIVD